MSTVDGSFPPPPPPPPPPESENEDENGNKPWWQRWYTIVGAVIIVLIAVAAIVGSGDGGDESGDAETAPDTTALPAETAPAVTSEAPSSTAPTTTTQATDTTSPPTTAAPTTTVPSATTTPPTTAPPSGEPTCRYIGTDSFDDMQVELSFTNPLGDQPSLEVSYALLDADNVRFLTEGAFVDLAAADERFQINDDTAESVPSGIDESQIGCAILDIAEGFSFGEVTEPAEGDVCEFESIDSFGDIQVQLTMTSPFSDTTNVQIFYALRGPDRVRFDDDSALVDLVAPGETIRSNEDSGTEVPEWMSADDVTCDILGIEATDF